MLNSGWRQCKLFYSRLNRICQASEASMGVQSADDPKFEGLGSPSVLFVDMSRSIVI